MPLEDRTTVASHPTAQAHAPEHGNALTPPDETDIQLAARVVRLHCVQQWPDGPRCNNCQCDHPCAGYVWGAGLLAAAGWTDDRIDLLDERRGAWA